ncbi:LacI family DNA-binding transcriptional regulator [Microbacterium terrisoli]|uniref:LacI family DNA-binding transcriptional regulator n=1 Tax=Microbacterium terrisoli TaxID=3242192 RepID=UPI002805156F|nr:LacI family DNA-binding transcriptional regulator [Microbacterium protaetiae]
MAPARSTNQPSIRDVALRAGVSHMTVSRVLNDSDNVSAATRDRVQTAITELDFRPSRTARALARGHTQVLGVLDATGGLLYGPSSTINAIELAGRTVGYSVTIAGVDPSDADSVHEALAHLLSQDAAGLIIIGPSAQIRQAVAEARPGVPVVTMHGSGETAAFTEHADAAAAAAHHLLGLGHTRIAVITGPLDWSEAVARHEGFARALADAGLEPIDVQSTDWSAASGYDAGLRLLDGDPFTAVFCANDQIALGFLHAAHEHGVRVPDDISVVGFDDTPESAHYTPPLTTLRQDFAEAGRRAVALVLATLAGDDAPGAHPPIAPQLVVRASTAHAPHH